MRFAGTTATVVAFCIFLAAASPVAAPEVHGIHRGRPKPKVFIISMFAPEADVWYGIPEFNLLERNISVPGFSPLYPQAHCTADGEVCQLVTGEGKINAAVTMTALYSSGLFDLVETYFLVGGIAGISPERGTVGSVTFARFAVQVDLQYEIDYREVPAGWPTGRFAQGSYAPGEYPGILYGTEVFELNDNLRQLALQYASSARLSDSAVAIAYRARYGTGRYAAGSSPPSVIPCDTATSDTASIGRLAVEAFENYTALITGGEAVFCTSQQEDNATLEALSRGSKTGLLDFARVIVMRAASDFDRPYPGQSAFESLHANAGGHEIAATNIYLAGVRVVRGILENWHDRFRVGVEPRHGNCVGDALGTLGRSSCRIY